MSHDRNDAARLERFPERRTAWREVPAGRGKGDDIHIAPWYCFLRGELADYPQQILAAQWAELARRMDLLRNDDGDPETWDVHHWQDINPVHTEALVQLTCGGPQLVYHGGLLHVRLRYFDRQARRPGLPPDVAALVHQLDADSAVVTLVNISPLAARQLIVQAGAFGEHEFTAASELNGGAEHAVEVGGQQLAVELPPGRQMTLRLGMRRFAHQPSYTGPQW